MKHVRILSNSPFWYKLCSFCGFVSKMVENNLALIGATLCRIYLISTGLTVRNGLMLCVEVGLIIVVSSFSTGEKKIYTYLQKPKTHRGELSSKYEMRSWLGHGKYYCLHRSISKQICSKMECFMWYLFCKLYVGYMIETSESMHFLPFKEETFMGVYIAISFVLLSFCLTYPLDSLD